MERYLAAAEKVARTALYGVESMKPTLVRLNAGQRQIVERTTPLTEYDVTGLSLPNALHGDASVPVDGRVPVQGVARRRASGRIRSADRRALDRRRAGRQRATSIPPTARRSSPIVRISPARRVEFTARLTAGQHWFAVTVPRLYEGLPARYSGPNPAKRPLPPPEEFKPPANATPERLERMRKIFEARQKEIVPVGEARVSFVEIAGPYDQVKGPSAESRARVYVCGHARGAASGVVPDADRRRRSRVARSAGR